MNARQRRVARRKAERAMTYGEVLAREINAGLEYVRHFVDWQEHTLMWGDPCGCHGSFEEFLREREQAAGMPVSNTENAT